MPTWELTVRLAAGVLLTALNALFVLTEFALTRAPSLGAEAFSGRRALRLAWTMTGKLEIYLTACQLGISSTSILLGIVAEPAVTHLVAPLTAMFGASGQTQQVVSVVTAVVIINLIHKIWGEQAPTYFGVEVPLKAAAIGAPFLFVWTKLFYPLVIAGDGLAKLTLRLFGVRVTRSWTSAETEGPAATQGGEAQPRAPARAQLLKALALARVPADRKAEVVAAYDMAEVPVRDIMVPRAQVEHLDLGRPLRENLAVLQRAPKSRYPLTRGGLDQVIGIIYTKVLAANLPQLLADELTLEALGVEPTFVDEQVTVDRLVDQLQAASHEIAIVTAGGRVTGLVTQTDAFEQVVGALEDPLDLLERVGAVPSVTT